jgi:peptidoglycan/LPS O-acetylase OafA/YrhL
MSSTVAETKTVTALVTPEPSTPVDSTAVAPEQHYPFLDFIRFAAALLVLFGHARGLLLEGIGNVQHPNALIRAFYLATGLQHEGVVLFFVVSGFLIGGSAWRIMQRGRFDFFIYFINRFARIYLVFIPALILVLVLETLVRPHLFDTRFYGVRPLLPAGIFDGWTWDQIPCHLLAVQGLICTPWGADLPLWSLGYEWAFYMIGPALFALVLVPIRRRAGKMLMLAAGLAVLTWWHWDWLFWFLVWMFGVFAARRFETRPAPLFVGLLGLAFCGAGLIVSRLAILSPYATDLAVAIGLTAAITCRPLMGMTRGWSFIRRGAGFSYSLYLIHLPLCVLAGALYQRFLGWPNELVQPDLRGISGFAVMTLAVALCAHLFARMTEDHTAAVRHWLAGRLRR